MHSPFLYNLPLDQRGGERKKGERGTVQNSFNPPHTFLFTLEERGNKGKKGKEKKGKKKGKTGKPPPHSKPSSTIINSS